eukprot:gnl/Trimastix_PCT/3757.p1 GENE.gnl/Trimastix_PCT/3757~~gnl/Trimastix_PCT/3757.p1  ORF type:complete len:638 (-),score=37.75 gnl/Trimastix_PCT/3757:67-1857(-)
MSERRHLKQQASIHTTKILGTVKDIPRAYEPPIPKLEEHPLQPSEPPSPARSEEPVIFADQPPEDETEDPEPSTHRSDPRPLETLPQVNSGTLYPATHPEVQISKAPALPQIAYAFRQGYIDWHDYVVDNYKPPDMDYDLYLLIQHEYEIIKLITGHMFRSNDYGPLANYTVCTHTRDPCLIHSTHTQCAWDGFCAWCTEQQLCVDRTRAPQLCSIRKGLHNTDYNPYANSGGSPPDYANHLPAPLTLEEGGKFIVRNISGYFEGADQDYIIVRGEGIRETKRGDLSECQRVVPGHFHSVEFTQQQMYWHWLRDNYKPIIKFAMNHATWGQRRLHFMTSATFRSFFYSGLGLLSDNCHRFWETLPAGTCLVSESEADTQSYVNAHQSEIETYRTNAPSDPTQFILHAMNLQHVRPTQPHIGIVARLNKRLILNLEELVQATHALYPHAKVSILELEDMTFFEQVKVIREITILVGIHGSGNANHIFMHPGTALVEITPYRTLLAGQVFTGETQGSRVVYIPLPHKNPQTSLYHWHFLPNQKTYDQKQSYLEQGCKQVNTEYFTFWINQDLHIDVEEYSQALGKAMQSKVNQEVSGF